MTPAEELAYGTANKCPACWRVHAQPTDWPRCPTHGHWMYEAGLELNDAKLPTGNWTYACQATYPAHCKYRHTQPERATMTPTNEAVTAALAIRGGQETWTPQQIAAFRQLGMDGAPEPDLAVFLHRCQATGLDPFAGQITMIKRGGKWTIQTGIDGYRVIAQRAAARAGVTLSYGPTFWYDTAGAKSEIWLGAGTPAGASVTVYKDGKPFPGIARFHSFAAYNGDGGLVRQWATMPDHMIAKCAEAQALRKAFPHDLDGIAASDETAHLDAADIPPGLTVQQIPAPEPPQRQQSRPSEATKLRNAIGAEFDRLGLDDRKERAIYVYKLANQPEGVELTDQELRFVLDSLHHDPATGDGCEDLAALIDLCAVEAS